MKCRVLSCHWDSALDKDQSAKYCPSHTITRFDWLSAWLLVVVTQTNVLSCHEAGRALSDVGTSLYQNRTCLMN